MRFTPILRHISGSCLYLLQNLPTWGIIRLQKPPEPVPRPVVYGPSVAVEDGGGFARAAFFDQRFEGEEFFLVFGSDE